jgi:hypothetical protein
VESLDAALGGRVTGHSAQPTAWHHRAVDEPILRATNATGETYDDPSEDALYMFIEDLRSSGSFVRVVRLEDDRKCEWAQVAITKAGLYEFDSSEHVHYVGSLRSIHDFLTRWAFGLPSG